MALKTNFTDDILSESMNGKRQYNITENSNGTKSLEDVTDYQSVGSTFSAKNMNETNAAVNQAYDDIGDEFNPEVDYAVGDYTIRNNKIWKFTTARPAGAWDESHVKATKILSEARELTENLQNHGKIVKLLDNLSVTTSEKTVTVDDITKYRYLVIVFGGFSCMIPPELFKIKVKNYVNTTATSSDYLVSLIATYKSDTSISYILNIGSTSNKFSLYGVM